MNITRLSELDSTEFFYKEINIEYFFKYLNYLFEKKEINYLSISGYPSSEVCALLKSSILKDEVDKSKYSLLMTLTPPFFLKESYRVMTFSRQSLPVIKEVFNTFSYLDIGEVLTLHNYTSNIIELDIKNTSLVLSKKLKDTYVDSILNAITVVS